MNTESKQFKMNRCLSAVSGNVGIFIGNKVNDFFVSCRVKMKKIGRYMLTNNVLFIYFIEKMLATMGFIMSFSCTIHE